ncbi:MAG: sorbosone dehydrogenase, partial [Burkholderiales bacterium]
MSKTTQHLALPCAALAALFLLGACAESAKLTVAQGTGPNPSLPEPVTSVIPTVNIAPAKGWPAGTAPVPAAGLGVVAFASGLDHPRWLMVLPNGDVLVAESNAPPKPAGSTGVKDWIAGQVMK